GSDAGLDQPEHAPDILNVLVKEPGHVAVESAGLPEVPGLHDPLRVARLDPVELPLDARQGRARLQARDRGGVLVAPLVVAALRRRKGERYPCLGVRTG